MLIEATRRRDDQMAALTRSALQDQERDYQAFGEFYRAGVQFPIARTADRHDHLAHSL